MSGAEIAAQVAAALGEAGEATGDGPLIATLKRPATGAGEPDNPWSETPSGDPSLHEVTCTQTKKQIRDADGTLIGKTMTVLLVEATGVAPIKSDVVAVGVRKDDVTEETQFHEIAEVVTIAPGGVGLMYKVMLSD